MLHARVIDEMIDRTKISRDPRERRLHGAGIAHVELITRASHTERRGDLGSRRPSDLRIEIANRDRTTVRRQRIGTGSSDAARPTGDDAYAFLIFVVHNAECSDVLIW